MNKMTVSNDASSRAKLVAILATVAMSAALACGCLVGCSAPAEEDTSDADTAATETEAAQPDEGQAGESGDMGDVAVPGGTEGAQGAAEATDGEAAEAGDVDEFGDMLAETDESRDAVSKGDMQTIGSNAVGYLAVPSTWTDRIGDVDPNLVDAYEMVYYADPDSEYTSAAFSHFTFSKGVQMTVQPTSYREIAQGIAESYENSPITGDYSQGEVKIGGRDAILIVTSIPEDNQLLCSIVIDRDGDGHAAVALACNCGASTKEAEEVLSYVATWQPA